MTRREFDLHFAATADNWFEPATLDELNNRTFALVRHVDINDRLVNQIVKNAFDLANNEL